jgi:tRNA nucleotidyltransferase (CCA-adding enzyme)
LKINIAKKFPKNFLPIINAVGRSADRDKISAYIVGGPVRDALLSVKNHDLDFVVEGDAIRFAGCLNSGLRGSLNIHKTFGTATISFEDGRIDIVTAREETYKRPAAYPDVKPATIKEDLFRRDFTINAMAISVNSKNFGELVDLYGGRNDLKKKVIRIMHDKSFIDDPTRIFRAVRFSVRFGFRIDPRTRKLIKDAVSQGLVGEVNRGRVKKEIEILLKEKKPVKCLKALSDLV